MATYDLRPLPPGDAAGKGDALHPAGLDGDRFVEPADDVKERFGVETLRRIDSARIASIKAKNAGLTRCSRSRSLSSESRRHRS